MQIFIFLSAKPPYNLLEGHSTSPFKAPTLLPIMVAHFQIFVFSLFSSSYNSESSNLFQHTTPKL